MLALGNWGKRTLTDELSLQHLPWNFNMNHKNNYERSSFPSVNQDSVNDYTLREHRLVNQIFK